MSNHISAEMLAAYVTGMWQILGLEKPESDQIEAHLGKCDQCEELTQAMLTEFWRADQGVLPANLSAEEIKCRYEKILTLSKCFLTDSKLG